MNEEAASVSRITTPFLPSKPWFFVAGLALVLLAGAVLPLWATFGWSWFLATLLLYGIIFSWVIARFPTPLPIGGLLFQGLLLAAQLGNGAGRI